MFIEDAAFNDDLDNDDFFKMEVVENARADLINRALAAMKEIRARCIIVSYEIVE